MNALTAENSEAMRKRIRRSVNLLDFTIRAGYI